MMRNYLRIALRHLRKHKTYSVINITGLAIGLCCCLLIVLFVQDELSYDAFHHNAERIFRVKIKLVLNDVVYEEASIQFPAAEALSNDIPEIEQAVRLYKRNIDPPLLEYEDQTFTEEQFLFADANFFKVFDFPLVQGDEETALHAPNSVVITERTARKYFGTAEPLGKTFTYDGEHILEVTGVVENPPRNAHFTFDFLAPLSFQLGLWQQERGLNGRERGWFWTGAWTYVLLSDAEAASAVTAKFPAFIDHYFPERYQEGKLALQPLKAIYLHSRLGNELGPTSHIQYVYIFSAIALFVLLIACINFTNLATAQSMQRTREVGVRKALGAANTQLRTQLFGESILLSLLAGVLALLLALLLLPAFNELAGKQLAFSSFTQGRLLLGLLLLTLAVGIISGFYPAVFLSRLHPVAVFKGVVHPGTRRETFRKGLFIVQFTLSVMLMISIGTIYRQMQFIQAKALGFTEDQVLIITARPEIDDQFDAFRDELLRHPGIVNVAGMSDIPGRGANGYRFVPEGGSVDEPLMLPLSIVDHHFLETLAIALEEGRGFSKDFPADIDEAFILNEKAVRTLGWEGSAVGRKMDLFAPGTEDIAMSGRVIGVIKDYHFESLHHEIKPLVLIYYNEYSYYAVKLEAAVLDALDHAERTWKQFATAWPINYFFLNHDLAQLYRQERRLAQVVGYFALLALLIASLGLLGLSSFTVVRRTKEISIRKVFGASLSHNLVLLSREFLILVLISLVMALPLAYYAMSQWLNNFAYHRAIELWLFLLAGLLALGIALATVSYQCLKVALARPAETLRHE